jgi:hypothetical protein
LDAKDRKPIDPKKGTAAELADWLGVTSKTVYQLADRGIVIRGGRGRYDLRASKTVIFDRLQRGRSIRFSHTLELSYFEQLAAEKRIVRYKRGRPVRRFERVSQASSVTHTVEPGAHVLSVDLRACRGRLA